VKQSTAEIPCYLFEGITFGNKEEALKEIEQRAADLGLPRSEQEIFIVVIRHAIEMSSSSIRVSEIASGIKERKKVPPIEPKNVHPLVDRLCAKGLLRLARESPIEVEPVSPSDLNYYWFTTHYYRQKAAFEAFSTVASLLNSYCHHSTTAQTRTSPQHYDDNSSFLFCLCHALFSANDSILVVANYFSALIQFPLLASVLKKKKDDGVHIKVIVKRESRAIPKMRELGLDIRVLTGSIPCRIMIIDERSVFVNTRYEGGERLGAYYQDDEKQVASIRNTWLNKVVETSEPLE
jgi:hypothetical protein